MLYKAVKKRLRLRLNFSTHTLHLYVAMAETSEVRQDFGAAKPLGEYQGQ